MKTLIIDEEFRDLLPRPTSSQCYPLLEKDLIENKGPRDPILVWKGHDIIVDGYRRYGICQKHKLPYSVKHMEFATRSDVKIWMLRNQLQRRNLTPQEQAQFLTYLYREIERQKQEGATTEGAVADQVAEAAGVTRRTVYRAKQHVEALESLPEDIRNRFTSGDVKASRRDIATLANYTESHQRAILHEYDERKDEDSFATVLHGEGNEEGEEDLEIEEAGLPEEPESDEEDGEAPTVPLPRKPPQKPFHDVWEDAVKQLAKLRSAIHTLEETSGDSARYTVCQTHLDALSAQLEGWKTEAA